MRARELEVDRRTSVRVLGRDMSVDVTAETLFKNSITPCSDFVAAARLLPTVARRDRHSLTAASKALNVLKRSPVDNSQSSHVSMSISDAAHLALCCTMPSGESSFRRRSRDTRSHTQQSLQRRQDVSFLTRNRDTAASACNCPFPPGPSWSARSPSRS